MHKLVKTQKYLSLTPVCQHAGCGLTLMCLVSKSSYQWGPAEMQKMSEFPSRCRADLSHQHAFRERGREKKEKENRGSKVFWLRRQGLWRGSLELHSPVKSSTRYRVSGSRRVHGRQEVCVFNGGGRVSVIDPLPTEKCNKNELTPMKSNIEAVDLSLFRAGEFKSGIEVIILGTFKIITI